MKNFRFIVLSAILIGFSFPTVLLGIKLPPLGFLAWFGLVPLLFLITPETTPRKAFQYGFLTAFLFYLIAFYWIVIALRTFGNIALPWSILTTLLLAATMALYIGAVFFLTQFFVQRGGERIIVLPALWTLAEWARHFTPFQGFPWGHLALSQTHFLPLIQIADVTGVFGIIFLLVWFNVWLTELILKFKKPIPFFIPKTIATLLFAGLVLIYGFFQLHSLREEKMKTPSLLVGLIQPNISQEEKGDPHKQREHLEIFKKGVAQMNRADLIIWPETAWGEVLEDSHSFFHPSLLGLDTNQTKRPWNLIGLNTVSFKSERDVFYNSAFLIDPTGFVASKYHKMHLVPFGEYVPLKRIFVFLEPVVAIGNFEAGKNQSPLEMNGLKLAPLICFEDIFPNLSRTMVQKGAKLLVNITNDAWYGFSSAPYQHLALAQFRAIETRRAMVRATNTGMTAVIDATGEILVEAPIFEQSLLIHKISLWEKETLYTEVGNWFIASCILLLIWQGVIVYVQRIKRAV